MRAGPGSRRRSSGPTSWPASQRSFTCTARAAALVGDDRLGTFRAGEVLVAPLAQRGEHRVEVLALLGQVVLEAAPLAGLLVVAALEHAVLDEVVQAGAEHRLGHAHVLVHVAEAPDAPHHLAQDQHDPRLPDEVHGAADGAVGSVSREVVHGVHDSWVRQTELNPATVSDMLSTSVEPRRTLTPRLAYAHVAAVIGLALFASGTPSPALHHLPRALGLLAGRAHAGLRDLRLRRAGRAAARRPAVGRDRPPAGAARRARHADGHHRPLHVRRLDRLAVRRPRPAGRRHRPRARRRQRRAAGPAPGRNPAQVGLTNGVVSAGGMGLGVLRLRHAGGARAGAAGAPLRRPARALRDRLRRRAADARAGRRHGQASA